MRDLLATPDGATCFAGQLWGVSLRYDLGDGHALVGRSAPDFAFDDGSRLAQHLRDGAGVLVDFSGRASLRPLAERRGGSPSLRASRAADELGLAALLVRPDGVVAWASDVAPAPARRRGRHGALVRRCAYAGTCRMTSATDTNLRAVGSHRTYFSADGIPNSPTRVTPANRVRAPCGRRRADSSERLRTGGARGDRQRRR